MTGISPPGNTDGLYRAIRAMSKHTLNRIFGTWYVILILMVTFPPAYLAASGGFPHVIGLPLSVFYMVVNGALSILLVWALWTVESIRGEHEQFHEDVADGSV